MAARWLPVIAHLLAWLVIGFMLGILITPELQLASLLGHTLSGMVCCLLLGGVTFPLCENSRFVIIGGLTGALAAAAISGSGQLGLDMRSTLSVGLIFGAQMGGTSRAWLLPIRMILGLARRIVDSIALVKQ